jgi:hypothetical protein
MAKPTKRDLVAALLDRHGRTYADELGIELEGDGTPSNLFRLLCASILYSARISGEIATQAAENLRKEGWTTAEKLAASTWKQRVRALNDAGYTRYQERTATMLGDTAAWVQERFGGDLRRLREEAGRDPDAERRLLKRAKGMGDVGVDVFFREVQTIWDELRPFADRRALEAAKRLDLASDTKGIARLADGDLAPLVAALVRTRLAGDYDEIRDAARDR